MGWRAPGPRLLGSESVVVVALLLGIGLILAGCYYVGPAPPPYVTPAPVGAPPGYVYVPAQWVWGGAAWVWRPAYWAPSAPALPPPGSTPPGQPPPLPPQAPKP
jgi:hypothetical protein